MLKAALDFDQREEFKGHRHTGPSARWLRRLGRGCS